MPDEQHRIPEEWLRGARLNEHGDVDSVPFTTEETRDAWFVFKTVRDLFEEMGVEGHPADPLAACLWAGRQWTRIHLESLALMRKGGGQGSTH